MKKVFFISLLLGFALVSCNSDPEENIGEQPNQPDQTEESVKNDDQKEEMEELESLILTRAQMNQVSVSNDFAFRLAQATMQSNTSEVLSPLSVSYVVGMLANGVSEKTLGEVTAAMGMDNMTLSEINDYFELMLKDLPRLDLSSELLQSNAIFVNRDYSLLDDYVNTVGKTYSADFTSLDFRLDSSVDYINLWASDHTKGMIDEVVNYLNPAAVAYGLNAVYFKGSWVDKFDVNNTKDEAFGKGGKQVPMMHLEAQLKYASNEYCQLLQMPYGNGAFQMTVLLPNEGISTTELMGMMNDKQFNNMLYGLSRCKTDVKIPRFETSCKLGLNDALKKIGLSSLYSPEERYDKMSMEKLVLEKVAQTARIRVDEEGSEAAAVTHWEATSSGKEQEVKNAVFHANRPFIYLISEKDHGIILFVGHYEGE